MTTFRSWRGKTITQPRKSRQCKTNQQSCTTFYFEVNSNSVSPRRLYVCQYVGLLRLHPLRCGTKLWCRSPLTKNVHCETQLLSKVEGIRHSHVSEHVSSLLFDSLGFCLKINRNIVNTLRRIITMQLCLGSFSPTSQGGRRARKTTYVDLLQLLFELFRFVCFPLVPIISLG